jgi:hypothetical protein
VSIKEGFSRCNLTTHAALSEVSPWVRRWLGAADEGAVLLDWAAGSGRHSLFAAGMGFKVVAMDQVPPTITDSRIAYRAVDLESADWPLAQQERFDVILVTNYLFRSRLALLGQHLEADGLFIYETFANGQAEFGRPRNPEFLLEPGELLRFCEQQRWHVLAYEDGVISSYGQSAPQARVQRVAARCGQYGPRAKSLALK